jgi:hypothetical protein
MDVGRVGFRREYMTSGVQIEVYSGRGFLSVRLFEASMDKEE